MINRPPTPITTPKTAKNNPQSRRGVKETISVVILVLLSLISYISSTQACSGRFVNPITDICWSCLFPLTIGPVEVGGKGREDTENPKEIPCFCPKAGISVPGIPVGFWEPARLILPVFLFVW